MPCRSLSRSAHSSRRKGKPAGGAGSVSVPRPQATRYAAKLPCRAQDCPRAAISVRTSCVP
eukprot:9756728-Alexandrium_andersonii.AAC.1